VSQEPDIRAVVDASAVLAWVFDEQGSEVVDRVLATSGISAVNFAEVLYKCSERNLDPGDTEADLAAYGLTLLHFGGDEARQILAMKQAEVRSGLRPSLADRCCLVVRRVNSVRVSPSHRRHLARRKAQSQPGA
jgi:ribonuclease VapC